MEKELQNSNVGWPIFFLVNGQYLVDFIFNTYQYMSLAMHIDKTF